MADVATDGAEVTGADAGATDPGHNGDTTHGDPADRSSQPTAAQPSRFPRWGIYGIVGSAVALLFLTVVINRVANSSSTPTTTETTVVNPVVGGTEPPPDATQLDAPLQNLLGLTALHGQRAAGFSLVDAATGRTVTLASLHGQVVVLTFADSSCKDICPVLAAELHRAAADLKRASVAVSFVTVNTDPLATAPKEAAILHQPLLTSIPGWRFLTGSVHALDPVWTDYGISITANPATGAVSHNDFMYFITAKGTLAWSALPFADQSAVGSYSLPQAEIDRFATGVAHYAEKLAR
jgi:cytochrome oxidase Cu insertion factor (SCO1/SenC/PrrC family)